MHSAYYTMNVKTLTKLHSQHVVLSKLYQQLGKKESTGSGIISVDASGELCCWDIPTYEGWASS